MIIHGDALQVLRGMETEIVNCCVTSPPYYGLRDYGLPKTQWPAVDYSPLPGMAEIHIDEWEGCLGLEPTIEMFIGHIVQIFREVWRVLRNDGTLWMNFGDSYCSTAPGTMGDNIHIEGTKEATKRARKVMRPELSSGMKPKDLQGIPWRCAFALQSDGWFLRSDIIWHKPNPMPESVQDRPTKAHEYIFLLSKSKTYYYDAEAIAEPVTQSTIDRLSQDIENQQGSERVPRKTNGAMKAAAPRYGGKKYTENPDVFNRTKSGNVYEFRENRNKRDVWSVATQPFKEAHFATFPKALIRPCILAGCPVGGVALDPFFGSGTVGEVALEENRDFIGIELNPKYIKISEKRISNVQTKMII